MEPMSFLLIAEADFKPDACCRTQTKVLCVTSVAARHLAPSTVKDDVSHELKIANKRVWYGRRVLDNRSGPVERIKQLIGIDSFNEN